MKGRESHVYILGSGTSGTFLAFRLLEKGISVTLIDEQVDSQYHQNRYVSSWSDYFCLTPLSDVWTVEACRSESVEILRTTSQSGLKDRCIGYPCRKGIGGNSNINAMMHGIGHRFIYDEYWPKSWNFDEIQKYSVIVDRIISPYEQKISGNMEKIFQVIYEEASRQSAASSVVKDYPCCISETGLKRFRLIKILEKLPSVVYERLMIVKGKVKRLTFSGKSAIAVEFENGDKLPVTMNSKIVLCCGAVKSPSILYNSLSPGPNVLPSVSSTRQFIGNAALDHLTIPFICFGNWDFGWLPTVTRPLNGVHGWVFLDSEGNLAKENSELPPRTQLIFVDGSILVGLVDIIVPKWHQQSVIWTYFRFACVGILKSILCLSIVRWFCKGIFGVLVCLVQPSSPGKCSFSKVQVSETSTSEENGSTIEIDPQLFSAKEDQKALHHAYLCARQLLQKSTESTNLRYWEILPGPILNYAKSYSTFVEYAAWVGTTYFHISGTCSMDRYKNGKIESNGALTDNLQVKGTDNLFVADASVFPAIPSFPTAKLSMIVGIHAADILCREMSNLNMKPKSKMTL